MTTFLLHSGMVLEDDENPDFGLDKRNGFIIFVKPVLFLLPDKTDRLLSGSGHGFVKAGLGTFNEEVHQISLNGLIH